MATTLATNAASMIVVIGPALVAGIFAVIVALIKIRNVLGDPDSSITHMLSTLLQGQAGQDVRLAVLEHRTEELFHATERNGAALELHDKRLQRVERVMDTHLTDHSPITIVAKEQEK